MSGFSQSEFKALAIKQGHSEEFLDLTEKYINNLKLKGYPVIFSLKHLSKILDIDYSTLMYITYGRTHFYTNYEISKKLGGKRLLTCPKTLLREIQKWINNNILQNYELHKSCTGFRKGMSIKDNAQIHVNQECILKVDLSDFFHCINEKRVYTVFKKIGYHPNLAVYFAKLATVNISEVFSYSGVDLLQNYNLNTDAVLPQGAPTSPALANIVASKLDERLFKLAEVLGINYSRYADDITFSGEKNKLPSIKLIEKIVNESGFKINFKKVKFCYRKQGQMVTGLSICNGVKISKKYKKETFRHLHYCKTLGVEEHLAYLKKKEGFYKHGFREWLLGRIYFINSVEPKVAQSMLKEFNDINWII